MPLPEAIPAPRFTVGSRSFSHPRPPPAHAETRVEWSALPSAVHAELEALLSGGIVLSYGHFTYDPASDITVLLFWDPTGLDPQSARFDKTLEDFDGDNNAYAIALMRFLALNSDPATKPYANPEKGYTNYHSSGGFFSTITSSIEFDYQMTILEFLLQNKFLKNGVEVEVGLGREVYQHLYNELYEFGPQFREIQDDLTAKDIVWANQWVTTNEFFGRENELIAHRTDIPKPLTEWRAQLSSARGLVQLYQAYQIGEQIVVAFGAATGGAHRIAPGIFPPPLQYQGPRVIPRCAQ